MSRSQPRPLPLAEQAAHAVAPSQIRLPVGMPFRLGRIAAGYRLQAALSEELGWPSRVIHEIEAGHRRPSPEQLARLRAKLPVLDLLLRLGRPAPRDVEVAGRV